jgi:hypothetical protein
MEINRIAEILGVTVQADVVEGRCGLLVQNNVSTFDFGSGSELPGFKVPATAAEANFANYVITWTVSNQEMPMYVPTPSSTWALRHGFSVAANAPFAATVYATWPGMQESKTIPSGSQALALGRGTYTFPSGAYIYNASLIIPGAPVIVANTAEDTTDAGKLKYQSTDDERVIGVVESYDTTTKALTVRFNG